MKFTTSILTIFAASVLLLQSCGGDTTTNNTELANVLDAAADREGVPSGDCRDNCVVAALAVFDACTDDGGGREACFGRAILSFFDCAHQCGEPEPPTCEDECEEYAHSVYEQCLEDGNGGVEPKLSGTGGEEQRCAAVAREALEKCLAEGCVDPEPPTCEDECEEHAHDAYERCLEDGNGGVEPKQGGTGGEEQRCAAVAREVLAECLAEHCGDPEPTPIGCDEGRCLDTAQATMCEDAVAACIAFDPLNEEECILAGNFIFCEEGEPDPEPGEPPASGEVCNERLCAEPGVPRDECEAALALCVANTPEANWDECVLGVQLLFCGVI